MKHFAKMITNALKNTGASITFLHGSDDIENHIHDYKTGRKKTIAKSPPINVKDEQESDDEEVSEDEQESENEREHDDDEYASVQMTLPVPIPIPTLIGLGSSTSI